MRKTALVITLVAAAAAFTWANAATVAYKAALGGTAEVPPVQSAGKGTAQVNVDSATKQATIAAVAITATAVCWETANRIIPPMMEARALFVRSYLP